MSRKTTAALVAALGINLALAGGALFLAALNKPTAYAADEALGAGYRDLQQVAGKPVDAEAGDLAVPLAPAQAGGNTRITFTCGKDMGVAGREEHEGTWDGLAGAVLFNPDAQRLIAVEAVFDVRSLRTDARGLTNTVLAKEKWFDYENHPRATFTCDQVVSNDAATTSHTHTLAGTFTLNGIRKPLTISATLAFAGRSLTLDASFTILRSDFKVERRVSSLAGAAGGLGSAVDDEVVLTVRVTASPDPMAVLGELAGRVEEQQEQLRVAGIEIDRLKVLQRRVELLEEQADRFASSAPSASAHVDAAALPESFTDHAPSFNREVPFNMVLVPGNEEQGVAPFYMCEHEATWQMVEYWAFGGDVDAAEGSDRIAMGMQPTPLFGEPAITVQLNDKQHPAMAMSLLTARAYCKWLSEQTGRRYRLPTMKEWQHALAAGGGVPEDLGTYAWHAGNSPINEMDDMPLTSPVMSRRPNALGIHDLLGGVAEWVTDTGTDRVVVGGSIFTKPRDLTAGWRKVEDIGVWSASYPQKPESRFWYSDFYVTGIRLVCEAPSVVANPPAKTE